MHFANVIILLMQKILITGGTGLVGTALTQTLLAKGYGIHIFTRSANKNTSPANVQYYNWKPETGYYDAAALQGVTSIVNLAGAGVADERWTAARKQEILQSRVQSGNVVTKILQASNNNITTLIQASATGWYNPVRNTAIATQEDEAAATDYLGTTCKAWEDSIANVPLSVRVVKLRFGIILSKQGGMVAKLVIPMAVGILPVFGSGKQLVPWVHIADVCGIINYAITTSISGVYNTVASNPAAQKQLAKQIAVASHKRWFIAPPIPAFVLKLMLGEMSIEVLKSAEVSNDKIIKMGYNFLYPTVSSIANL